MKRILPLVIIFLIGTVSLGKADVLTLEATAGTIAKFKDDTIGTASGSNFVFRLNPIDSGLGIPIDVESLQPVPGQVIDQSGPYLLNVRHANINGEDCCAVHGTLNLSAIPSTSFLSRRLALGPTVEVTAPFGLSGILTATRDPSLPPGPPFSVDYLFEGTGTVTNAFRGSGSFPCDMPDPTSCTFNWEFASLTFAPPTSSTVPELSTWLLLGSGLTGLALRGRRRKSEAVAAAPAPANGIDVAHIALKKDS